MIITIDGPSASGKSTVARAVAKELHYFYIASGTIYRGLAYALMHLRGYSQETIAHVQEPDVMFCLDSARFVYTYDSSDNDRIILQGIDITIHLKSPAVDAGASLIGTNGIVREHILRFIQALAKHHDIVIDGRDCGSVMFPSADYKFYLDASVLVRAQRWQAMQAKLKKNISLDQAVEITTERDERDSKRSLAPLRVPHGASVIDSSYLAAQEVVSLIVRHVQSKKKEEV